MAPELLSCKIAWTNKKKYSDNFGTSNSSLKFVIIPRNYTHHYYISFVKDSIGVKLILGNAKEHLRYKHLSGVWNLF